MGERHVVGALREKRAEISGLILELEKELRQRRADLTHLDATLKVFAPDLSPQSIKPRRPSGRNRWFRHGERTRLVLDLLRLAQHPMTAMEIAEQLMEMKDIDRADALAREALRKTVLSLLDVGKAKGHIERIEGGPGEGVSWRIAP